MSIKTHLLTLFIFLGSFLSISLAHGDNISKHREWDDKDYRSITMLPPTLFIEGGLLLVKFTDALDGLTIHITNEAGVVVYENGLFADRSERLDIPLDEMGSGICQIMLTHKPRWLVGEFENQ